MNCEDFRGLLPDYWSGGLDDRDKIDFHVHLDACAACRKEAEHLGELWKQLGLVPTSDPTMEPSKDLRSRFYQALTAFKQGLAEGRRPGLVERLNDALRQWWPSRPVIQLAATVAALVIGLGVGFSLRSGRPEKPPENTQVAQLREEVNNMRQLVALSLLQQQSASDRLRGVSWAYRVEQSDTEVLSALLHTANHDQNVNVRLAAIDALRNFSESPVTRTGLIQSLAKQDSPLVEIALIDTLVDLREPSAAPALESMSRNAAVNPEVRQHARWAVGKLQ